MIIEEYDLSNLHCASCGAKIESGIAGMDGVSGVNLDFINNKLTVQYRQKVEDALARLNAIAKGIEPEVSISLSGKADVGTVSKPWHLVIAIIVLTISLRLPPLPFLVGSLLAYLIAGYKVIANAGRELFSKQVLGEHVLMTIATFGAIYLGEITEAVAVMVLYGIGQYLEVISLAKSRNTIKNLLALKPEKVHRKAEGKMDEIRTTEAKVGDVLLVYPGERVPLDGKIINGETMLDTSSVTGESEPINGNAGESLYAGYINSGSLIEMEVSSTDAESMISRMMKLIEQAGAKKSNTEKFIVRFACYYTPTVVAMAVLVFLIPWALGFPGDVWFKRALIFLIVSCPCALVISIPLSFYIGIGRAARQGIIFKGSIYLDLLHKVKTVVFDKTGTLTTGALRVMEVMPAPPNTAEALQEALYLCEYTSQHPFATAVKNAFTGDFHPDRVEALSEYPGKGVLLVYNGNKYLAGSEAFLNSLGYVKLHDTGAHSAVHAVKNDIYLGCVTFGDELKPTIKANLEALRHSGVNHLSMLSGDKQAKAGQVADQLGLDSYYAELLPEQKLGKLEEIMAAHEGMVAYCGDGLNDSPVLARADIGIAMGKIGAQASIETADIVLLNDRPEQLSAAFATSHHTQRLVWQNISLALGIKVLVMTLGLTGIGGLWEAIIADVGVTLLVILNSLRMLRTEKI